MSRILILRDPATRIEVHTEHLRIKTPLHNYAVAYRHIETIYLNKAIPVTLSQGYTLCTHVKLYLVDHHGYILAKLEKAGDETV